MTDEQHPRPTAPAAPGAAAPDEPAPLRDVAEMAVAALADYCVVDLCGPGGLERAAVACSRRGEPALVRALRAAAPGAEAVLNLEAVAREDAARLVPRLPDGWARTLQGAEQLELLEGRAPAAALMTPIPGPGRPYGVLTLLALDPHGFPPRALDTAASLARLAAAAVERDRWRQAASVAEQARQDFLAVVSHELRTPLTTIIGYSDLLRTGTGGPLNELQRDRIDRIADSAWQLVREMDQILELVRAQSPEEAVRLDTIELAGFTSNVAHLVEPIARQRGLEFRMARPEVRIEVVTDPDKLRRALLNLLDNAVRYTRHGWVALESAADNGQVRFAVRDSGVGIRDEDRGRLFEPFYRGRPPNELAGPGMGLGLSLARQLVRQLDGDLRIDSRPGEGTTVEVRVPRNLRAARPSLALA